MTTTVETHSLITTVDGAPRLVGARCDECGTHAFPLQRSCPRCGSSMSEVALPPQGSLWSWTVQRIRPKPPYAGSDEFEPYAVGYVDLGVLKVEGRLAGREPGAWEIGELVRLESGDPDAAGDVWRYRWTVADQHEVSS